MNVIDVMLGLDYVLAWEAVLWFCIEVPVNLNTQLEWQRGTSDESKDIVEAASA